MESLSLKRFGTWYFFQRTLKNEQRLYLSRYSHLFHRYWNNGYWDRIMTGWALWYRSNSHLKNGVNPPLKLYLLRNFWNKNWEICILGSGVTRFPSYEEVNCSHEWTYFSILNTDRGSKLLATGQLQALNILVLISKSTIRMLILEVCNVI